MTLFLAFCSRAHLDRCVCLSVHNSTIYGILHALIAHLNFYLIIRKLAVFIGSVFVSFLFFYFCWIEIHVLSLCTPVRGTRLISSKHVFPGGHTSPGVCVLMPGGGRSRSVITLSTNHWPLVNSCPSYWGLIAVACISVPICKHEVRYPPISFNVVWLF